MKTRVVSEPISVAIVVSVLGILSSAASVGCGKPPPPRAPEQQTLTYVEQLIEPTTPETESQRKGAVVLQAAPVKQEASSREVRKCRYIQSGDSFAELANKSGTPHRDYYEVRTSTVYELPPTVQFKIEVGNDTPQVLKLDESIVRMSVDGTDIDSKSDLSTGVLAPGERRSYGVTSGGWTASAQIKTIRLAVYGVPTEAAEDGRVAKRENFEWSFKYSTVETAKQVTSQVPIVAMSMDEGRACR